MKRRRLAILGVLAVAGTIGAFRASHWLTAHGLTAVEYANELQRDEPRFQ